jgi:hypothetical protein
VIEKAAADLYSRNSDIYRLAIEGGFFDAGRYAIEGATAHSADASNCRDF